MSDRIQALAKALDCDVDDLRESRYGDNAYEGNGGEYLVLTDSEADDAVAANIRESVWAFNADWLASYVPDGITAEHLNTMRGDSCEDFNEAATALVEAGSGMDGMISDASAEDGRGHFLASYDGDELEAGAYFVYRTN